MCELVLYFYDDFGMVVVNDYCRINKSWPLTVIIINYAVKSERMRHVRESCNGAVGGCDLLILHVVIGIFSTDFGTKN